MLKLKISDDCVLFFRNGSLIIDNYVKHVQKAIKIEYSPILLSFNDWTSEEGIEKLIKSSKFKEEEYLTVLRQLIDNDILVSSTDLDNKSESDASSPFKVWNKSVNYFHFSNRILKSETFKNVLYEFKELKKSEVPMPILYKRYKDTDKVKLPPTSSNISDKNFQDVLLDRETIRSFDLNKSITLDQLSNILYYVFGAVSCSLDHGIGPAIFKTSPSGGGRSSIEAYPVIFNVEGIESGLYHYSVENHELELLKTGCFREELINLAGDQVHVGWPCVSIIYTSVLERVAWKYKTSRGYKAIYMDVGHLSQTQYLVSNWMGLGAFFVGALRDEVAEDFLNINPCKEIAVGISGIGVMKKDGIEEGRFVREDVDFWRDRGE